MLLAKARIRDYRSINDTGLFDVESDKTILVGPNEAGKTAILQALQQINPPDDVPKFDALRDYPRARYNDITTGKVHPSKATIAEAHFTLEPEDIAALPPGFDKVIYVRGRCLDNTPWHRIDGGPEVPSFGDVKKDLTRLAAHADANASAGSEAALQQHTEAFNALSASWKDTTSLNDAGSALGTWLDKLLPFIDEKNEAEEHRFDTLRKAVDIGKKREEALDTLHNRLPRFVLFNNYFRVRPLIQLDHLAERTEKNVLDDDQYDYGNLCLLKLLGFTPRELSKLGAMAEPAPGDGAALRAYRDKLDERSYQLNAASVRLTTEIRRVWNPGGSEADRLKIVVDRQYLKVVVEDDLGVEIELNQRSEGFQWLVSFFVVFMAESADKHENSILLLDEPGLNLHGLKQREFRTTLSNLSVLNQTIYSTHSPFLVGPDELHLVRVVEMANRTEGTKVHTSVSSSDSAALLPLQEALGYDLAQSLFSQQRNLVLEGLTDYWYVETMASLLRESSHASLLDKIALLPAGNAGKVVYYATILHAHKLKVAALLDSDAAGDQAAKQETLIHALGQKSILRTKDDYSGSVDKPEIEDLLRDTLIEVAKQELGNDIAAAAAARPNDSIVKILAKEVGDFSKYKLAKAFLRWSKARDLTNFPQHEIDQWKALIERINRALK
jgi:energy-coupling factor transporter ATP-binding protein EcfA2